jgi:hypothetical protein
MLKLVNLGPRLGCASSLMGDQFERFFFQSSGYYKQYSLGRTLGLKDTVLFAQLANAGATFPGHLSGWQTVAEQYFDHILNGGGPSFKTKGANLCSNLSLVD